MSFYQTRNLENKNNASLDHLRGQLSTYAEVLEEKIIQTAEYLRITAEKINEKKQELQSGKDTLQKEQQLKVRVEAIQKYQQDYQLLVERKAEMDHLGRLLEKKVTVYSTLNQDWIEKGMAATGKTKYIG